jgi:phosphohistidine phosphatase
MAKTLLLLRHGKSDWSSDKDSDFDRPLAKRGREAALLMAQYLAEEDLVPDVIFSSPAKRALSTAEILQEEFTDVDITEDDAIYEATLDTMLELVAGLPEDTDTVLVVGHNPVLEELTDELAGRDDTVLKTCSLAILRSKAGSWEDVTAGSCRLVEVVNPAEVEA